MESGFAVCPIRFAQQKVVRRSVAIGLSHGNAPGFRPCARAIPSARRFDPVSGVSLRTTRYDNQLITNLAQESSQFRPEPLRQCESRRIIVTLPSLHSPHRHPPPKADSTWSLLQVAKEKYLSAHRFKSPMTACMGVVRTLIHTGLLWSPKPGVHCVNDGNVTWSHVDGTAGDAPELRQAESGNRTPATFEYGSHHSFGG